MKSISLTLFLSAVPLACFAEVLEVQPVTADVWALVGRTANAILKT